MEAVRYSETLVNFYQITRCHTPEDNTLHSFHCENLKLNTLQKNHTFSIVPLEINTGRNYGRFPSYSWSTIIVVIPPAKIIKPYSKS
jgi:hypothetical protein